MRKSILIVVLMFLLGIGIYAGLSKLGVVGKTSVRTAAPAPVTAPAAKADVHADELAVKAGIVANMGKDWWAEGSTDTRRLAAGATYQAHVARLRAAIVDMNSFDDVPVARTKLRLMRASRNPEEDSQRAWVVYEHRVSTLVVAPAPRLWLSWMSALAIMAMIAFVFISRRRGESYRSMTIALMSGIATYLLIVFLLKTTLLAIAIALVVYSIVHTINFVRDCGGVRFAITEARDVAGDYWFGICGEVATRWTALRARLRRPAPAASAAPPTP